MSIPQSQLTDQKLLHQESRTRKAERTYEANHTTLTNSYELDYMTPVRSDVYRYTWLRTAVHST